MLRSIELASIGKAACMDMSPHQIAPTIKGLKEPTSPPAREQSDLGPIPASLSAFQADVYLPGAREKPRCVAPLHDARSRAAHRDGHAAHRSLCAKRSGHIRAVGSERTVARCLCTGDCHDGLETGVGQTTWRRVSRVRGTACRMAWREASSSYAPNMHDVGLRSYCTFGASVNTDHPKRHEQQRLRVPAAKQVGSAFPRFLSLFRAPAESFRLFRVETSRSAR